MNRKFPQGVPTPSVSFEVLTLGLTLGNGSGTDFGASQCIPMGPCRCRLTLGVFIKLENRSTYLFASLKFGQHVEVVCF